jgi:Nif-specific regulatory protein
MDQILPGSPHLTEEDVTLLYEVSNSIHAIRDLDEMLQTILQKIRAVFRVEGASLALHDAERGEFFFIRTLEEARNGEHDRKQKMRFPDHLGVAGWVLRERRPALIPDVTKDDRFFKGIDLQQDFQTRSMICLPLLTRRGLIGILYVLNKMEGEFTARDARLLEILSGTIAIAIENAQLYGELRQHASSLEQENLRLKSEVQSRFNLQGVVGSSAAMRRLFDLLEKVIDTSTTVLIQGETGTGKELIAKVIHYSGPRRDKPFVAENCGALTESLLESELFGHVRGAFTGAVSDKKGLFEVADGGTVFLDEVGDMSPAMQVKLLRVLQEGQFRPVGGSQFRKVDVRLIAATNRDLEEEVRKGNFREDLFYRVFVFPIVMPPLRERREDIPLLIEHFRKKFGKRLKGRTPRITPRAMDLFCRYDWPGNVREVENEVERAMTLSSAEEEIREEHLSPKIKASHVKAVGADGIEGGTLQDVTERIEQKMIREALKNSKGNRSQAARALGLTRQGLLNKITRYKIQV